MRNINWNYQEYKIIFKKYMNDYWNGKCKLKLSRVWKNISGIYNWSLKWEKE